MMLFGLIGRKLGHSWSVPIHRELGRADYALYELEPAELAPFLGRGDLGGMNVTIPYKRDAAALCDELSPTARAIGSVNTVVRRDGKLYGYNTDACGFRFMAERAGVDFRGKKVVIFGSGGASLTAQYSARTLGASEVVVVSRAGGDNYQNLGRHADADIAVNCTPVGMFPNAGVAPAELGIFKKLSGVLDMVYNPRRTALLLRAESLGIPCCDGLPMLVAQAKAAAELFDALPIPDSETARILAKLSADMSNIVLIGMPGSGKSAIGAALAAATGRDLVDIDAEIVKTAGRTIPEIFASDGEKRFREFERVEISHAGQLLGKIIVTGGGAVKDVRNLAPLRQNGRIYHIERDIRALPRDGRPLSEHADLAEMYASRAPMYESFRDAVIYNDSTIESAAEAILTDFKASCN